MDFSYFTSSAAISAAVNCFPYSNSPGCASRREQPGRRHAHCRGNARWHCVLLAASIFAFFGTAGLNPSKLISLIFATAKV
jgi:hypothetical protein